MKKTELRENQKVATDMQFELHYYKGDFRDSLLSNYKKDTTVIASE